MSIQLKVHPSFFKEFATKTWISPNDIIKELIENAFDEDATKVLITIFENGSISIEDDAGMDASGIEKFLLLGSPHKKIESMSPKLRRIRTGRYGTGRLSFLTSFESMKIKTRRSSYNKCLVIDAKSLDKLFTGNSKLNELKEKILSRNGTEIVLYNAKMALDPIKLSKEIRKLPILRQPLFQVFIKQSTKFKEWNFNNAEIIKAQEIQGYRIPVTLDDGRILGELIVARRPLTEEEKGIGIMIGNHTVMRSSFGFDTKLGRVTGLVRCDSLTSRFADKSAIIEDDAYDNFIKTMKQYIISDVIPRLSEYEDVLITKEESRIYKEIDKVLGQAVTENLESIEVEDYEAVEDEVISYDRTTSTSNSVYTGKTQNQVQKITDHNKQGNNDKERNIGQYKKQSSNIVEHQTTYESAAADFIATPETQLFPSLQTRIKHTDSPIKKIKTLKRTFALTKIGYKVIPYEDESDSRYGFTNESIVFVNKANSAYRAEAERGDEFLLRHIIRMVAEAIAEEKHPEGKDALELQNRLIGEAIKIHNLATKRR